MLRRDSRREGKKAKAEPFCGPIWGIAPRLVGAGQYWQFNTQ